MILTTKIETGITHFNVDYYRSLGYNDIKCNQRIIIPIELLPKDSNLKIRVRCDICGFERDLFYQKYIKNINNGGLYSCSTKCCQFKIKKTNLERYGCENYVNVEVQKNDRKFKYDNITKEIESSGNIDCKRCGFKFSLDNYVKNKNGRYKGICRMCRVIQHSNNRRKRDKCELSQINRINYIKNIHIHAWRNILKNYLNRKSLRKIDSTFDLLRYSANDLKSHLEKNFNDDMSWENYGKFWQIDHIIPVSLFKRDTPSYIVNSLENLRPLYGFINSSRQNKLDKDAEELIEKYQTYLNITNIIEK